MSVIAFRPLVTVTVAEHGSGKAIRALGFEPSAETVRRLADYRLVFRTWSNGFRLNAQFNSEAGGVHLAPITVRKPFVFGIRFTESDFLARYNPNLDPAFGPSLYLLNLKADGTARPSGQLSLGATVDRAGAARIVARRLNARADMTKTPKPASLKVTDRADPALGSESAGGRNYSAAFRRRTWPPLLAVRDV